MSPGQLEADGQRWKARPFLAALVVVALYAIPLGFSLLAVVGVARADLLAGHRWLTVLLLGATALTVSMLLERAVRRLLPLAALLRLTMLFPDRAPTRFKVARAAATSTRARALDGSVADAAEAALTLMTALGAHDRRTRGHSERVRVFSDMLAEQLHLDQADRDRLRWASLLHDIGKLEVPRAVLNKPAKLDNREFALMKTHPEIGAELTATLLPWLGEWSLGILEHHEKYDGTGYPAGIAGSAISASGRIIGMVDAFETMTAARAYKKAMATRSAREELARCAGTHFDPVYVRAFLGVSLPKLIWAMGPLSFLMQLPFLRVLAQTGARSVVAGEVATTVAGAAVIATVGVSGAYGGIPSQPAPRQADSAADVATAVAAAPTTAPSIGPGVPTSRGIAAELPVIGPHSPAAVPGPLPVGPVAPSTVPVAAAPVAAAPVQGPTAPVATPVEPPAVQGPTMPAPTPSGASSAPSPSPAPTPTTSFGPTPSPVPSEPPVLGPPAPPVAVVPTPPVLGPTAPPFIGPTPPPVPPPISPPVPPAPMPPAPMPPVVLPSPVVVVPSPVVVVPSPVALPSPVVVLPSPVVPPSPVVVLPSPVVVLPSPVVVGAATFLNPLTGEHLPATQTFQVVPVAGATGYECQVDNGGWTACPNPQVLTLSPGPHTVDMRGVNGTVAGSPATTSFTLTDPTVTFTAGPTVGTSHSTKFTLTAAPGLTLECSLNGAAFATCPSNVQVVGLTRGPQTLAVRPRNALGELGPPSTYSWIVA